MSLGSLDLATSFDFGTNTLTIDFPTALTSDRLTVTLADAITDMEGAALDGEIYNPSFAALPSGDGVAGGTAVLRIDVLQGDADGSGVVDEADAAVIVESMGFCAGDPVFIAGADVNADGCVNVLDVSVYQGGFGGELVRTDGEPPLIVARSPAMGATVRAAGLDAIVVTFSEPVAPFSINAGSLQVVTPTGAIRTPSALVLGPTDDEASFTFDPPLSAPGIHVARVNNGVADQSG
ncbi:MAG: Ig-like domain-containing protein, partial [Planctomycetota bacterium]